MASEGETHPGLSKKASYQTPRKMRNFLLDARFQLKYTMYVVILSVILTSVLGYLLYQGSRENSALLEMKALMMDGAVMDALRQEDLRTITYLFTFLGILVVSLTVMGIIITHRVAGPIYFIKRILERIGEGDLSDIRRLRRHDELKDFRDSVQTMVQSLRERETQDLVLLQRALDVAQGGGDPAPSLRELIEAKKARLPDP